MFIGRHLFLISGKLIPPGLPQQRISVAELSLIAT
jgi:hypothetical protein